MASTSLTLGRHLEEFIQREVASGRYATASEVVRAALRDLEERGKRLGALRAHLDEGIAELERGEGVEIKPGDLVRKARARWREQDGIRETISKKGRAKGNGTRRSRPARA